MSSVDYDDSYFERSISPDRERLSAVSVTTANFRRNTLDFIKCDPDTGRASARFDRILASGNLLGGLHRELTNAHYSDITWVAFSNDGSMMATGGGDWCVKLWDAFSLIEIPIFKTKVKKN